MTDPTSVNPNATVDERRAAILLGLTPRELRWFSRLLGLGRRDGSAEGSPILFSYEDLRQLSSAAAASAK